MVSAKRTSEPANGGHHVTVRDRDLFDVTSADEGHCVPDDRRDGVREKIVWIDAIHVRRKGGEVRARLVEFAGVSGNKEYVPSTGNEAVLTDRKDRRGANRCSNWR